MTNQKRQLSEEERYIPLDDHTNLFYTYDMGVSAALISVGFELVSMDKENPRKALFIFKREVGIENIVDSYWANRLEVKSRTFFDNLKMIKNRLHSD